MSLSNQPQIAMAIYPIALYPIAVVSFCQVAQNPYSNSWNPPALGLIPLRNFPGRQPNTLLRLTVRIGLPLYHCWYNDFQRLARPDERLLPGSRDERVSFVDHPENPILGLFSMTKLPNGLPGELSISGVPRPNILLSRVDGKELKAKEVILMQYFISSVKASVAAMSHLSYAEQSDTFFGRMTPENFVEFWNGEAKATSECPVKLGCKACGEVDGVTRACEECGVVKYCSRKCLENDRAAHKRVCVTEMGEYDEAEQAY